MTPTRHAISAMRMVDVILLVNIAPCFFFQRMKLEHLTVGP